mgnify:CR=1 FL=1
MSAKRNLRKLFTAGFALIPAGAVADTQRATVSVVAELPVAQAWEYLQDFSLPHNYVPGITRTEIVSRRTSGVGAHRRVYDTGGDYLEETIIDWRDGQGFTIRLHDGERPMAPFQRAEFSYLLSPAAPDASLIELSITFEMPWGGFGETLGEWFILPVMEKRLVQIAAGMKHFYETGMAATDADRDRLAAAVEVAPAAE